MGIIQHCTFVHLIFPTNWQELSNTILCSPNFSHKPKGIIQHYLFTEIFPQTDMIFSTNQRDFSHKPTQIFKKNMPSLDLNP